MQVDIAIPEVFVGGLLGSMLIYLFSAWACIAVGRTAQEVVNEVRRQFIELPGIMVGFDTRIRFEVKGQKSFFLWLLMLLLFVLQTYQEKPDYGRCVSIVASAALREMIKPGALAVISPIMIGNVFGGDHFILRFPISNIYVLQEKVLG